MQNIPQRLQPQEIAAIYANFNANFKTLQPQALQRQGIEGIAALHNKGRKHKILKILKTVTPYATPVRVRAPAAGGFSLLPIFFRPKTHLM